MIYIILQHTTSNESPLGDRLVIKALIPCQRTILTHQLKLLGEVSRYDLYYFSTSMGVRTSLRAPQLIPRALKLTTI